MSLTYWDRDRSLPSLFGILWNLLFGFFKKFLRQVPKFGALALSVSTKDSIYLKLSQERNNTSANKFLL